MRQVFLSNNGLLIEDIAAHEEKKINIFLIYPLRGRERKKKVSSNSIER